MLSFVVFELGVGDVCVGCEVRVWSTSTFVFLSVDVPVVPDLYPLDPLDPLGPPRPLTRDQGEDAQGGRPLCLDFWESQ